MTSRHTNTDPADRSLRLVGAMSADVDGADRIALVIADFERFALGTDLCHCPALAALFEAGVSTARAFASTFIATGMSALACADQDSAPPLRECTAGDEAHIELACFEQARLVLVVHARHDVRPDDPSAVVDFHPLERWRHFLEGVADAEWAQCDEPGSSKTRVALQRLSIGPGTRLHEFGVRQALRLLSVPGVLLELRLERSFKGNLPARRYARADGQLIEEVHCGHGDIQRQLAIATLGAMGRRDAGGCLLRLVESHASLASRRQALGQLLELDEPAGRAAAARLARSPHDPLRHHAQTLFGGKQVGRGRGRLSPGPRRGLSWFR